MKRLFALILTFLFVLTGCGAGEPTEITVSRSFRCPVTVEWNGLHYEAELTVTPEQCAAVFSVPDEMEGLKMTCRNDGVTVQLGADRAETPLPNQRQCFLYWLHRALAQPNTAVTSKDNACALHGAVEDQRYLLTLDRTSGRPLYFEIDPLDLTVKFQNCE